MDFSSAYQRRLFPFTLCISSLFFVFMLTNYSYIFSSVIVRTIYYNYLGPWTQVLVTLYKSIYMLDCIIFNSQWWLFPGIVAFEREDRLWLEEQNRRVNEIQTALQAHISDSELQLLVDSCLNHYTNLFRIKADAARADACYLVSGGVANFNWTFVPMDWRFSPIRALNVNLSLL